MLKTLHDELDRAALDAYGRSDLAPLIAVGRVRPVEGGKGYVLQ